MREPSPPALKVWGRCKLPGRAWGGARKKVIFVHFLELQKSPLFIHVAKLSRLSQQVGPSESTGGRAGAPLDLYSPHFNLRAGIT